MVDIAIIGSGVLGTFHAYHAALGGKSVAVLEKDLQPMESSVRNFGQVVPSGFAPGRWHTYGKYSTQLYLDLQKKVGIGVRNNGSVYLANTPCEEELLSALQASFHQVDYASELLNQEAVLTRWPSVKKDYTRSALFFPQEVSADPRVMVHRIHDYMIEQMGVQMHFLSPVIDINDHGDAVEIRTSNGAKIQAKQVIVCNGRDFKFLFPELFNASEIEVCKLAMMVTKPLPEIDLKSNILTGLTIRRYESFKALPEYAKLIPDPKHIPLLEQGIHILFKQRMDGSIVIGDSHHYRDVKESDALGFDYETEVGDLILEAAKEILDLPHWELAAQWNGYYAQMKGTEEIFDHKLSDNIRIVCAIGGKGMTASAGYAKASIERCLNVSLPSYE
jgi:FAD dependent oxidoreductase TIGR03364